MKAPLVVPGIAETNEDPVNTKESFSNSICMEQTRMAEHELSAFISAVKELFGPDQAQLSAVDWLDELGLMISRPDLQAEIGGRSRSRPLRDLQID